MITILGPTASGKTNLAVAFAVRLAKEGRAAEIISADSRQVYRGMDIGTGKDLEEYNFQCPTSNVQRPTSNVQRSTSNVQCSTSNVQCPTSNVQRPTSNVQRPTSNVQRIPYHLIDICEPGTKYNLFRYQQDFLDAYEDIRQRGVLPILCGGTGLYVEAVLKGYHLSPVPQNDELRKELESKSLAELTEILVELKKRNGSHMHNHTDVDTAQRAIRAIEIEQYNLHTPTPERVCPPIDSVIIGVNIDREERRRKITKRLRQRLEEGMVDEIRGLLNRGIPADDLIYYGLEYKYVTEYVVGRLSYDEMFRQLEIAIHQFAKRQMTWFRGMERRGFTIHWIDAMLPMEEKVEQVMQLLTK